MHRTTPCVQIIYEDSNRFVYMEQFKYQLPLKQASYLEDLSEIWSIW